MARTTTRRKTSRSKSLIKKAKTGGENTLLLIAGLAVAHKLNELAAKLLPQPAADGVTAGILPAGISKYATSGALILLGIFAPEVGGKYAKYLRPFGSGMAAYGGATAIKNATSVSLLSGAPNNGMGFLKHYREPVNFLRDEMFTQYPERMITRSASL